VVVAYAPIYGATSTFFRPDGQNPSATGWQMSMKNTSAVAGSFKAAVVCAR
jgi:hypothetical protein